MNRDADTYIIQTVAQLRDALADLPDDAPLEIHAPGATAVELVVDVGYEDRVFSTLDVPSYTV